jgi:hypothetical protein
LCIFYQYAHHTLISGSYEPGIASILISLYRSACYSHFLSPVFAWFLPAPGCIEITTPGAKRIIPLRSNIIGNRQMRTSIEASRCPNIPLRVILKVLSDWEIWLSTIKTIAEQSEIWDTCNSEEGEEPALPDEPIEPSWENLRKKHPTDWCHVYGVLTAQYERKLSAHKKKLQGCKLVANAVRQSIHEKYQVFIDQETPWGLLQNLRQHLSPDCDPTYKPSLKSAWRNLHRGLDNIDIDKWLLDCQTLQRRCDKAGITEASEASIQLLEAIPIASPGFYVSWIASVEADAARERSQEESKQSSESCLSRIELTGFLLTEALHRKGVSQRQSSQLGKATRKHNQEPIRLANLLVKASI